MSSRRMVSAKPIGLVCAGAVSQSWVTQLPGLSSWLGPVKAVTTAAGTRVVQSLRAGVTTDSWQTIAGCQGVLIYAESGLAALIQAMAESGADWKKCCVVLCSSSADSRVLAPLQALGAQTATLAVLEEGPYLVEGDPAAVRLIQSLTGAHRSLLVKLPREAKLPLLADLEAALEASLPVLTAAASHLRNAGLSAADAQSLVLAAFQRAARTRLKSPPRPPRAVSGAAAELEDRR